VTVATTAPAPDPRVPVPDLAGVRLDEASALLAEADLLRRIEGGGLFGVLDDSGWTVCATTPAAGVRVLPGETVVVRVERSCT
jgi:beta-lactam-binding protein with PASTA domain